MDRIALDALNRGWALGMGTAIASQHRAPDDDSWERALRGPAAELKKPREPVHSNSPPMNARQNFMRKARATVENPP